VNRATGGRGGAESRRGRVASPETLRVLDFPLLLDALAGQSQTAMGRKRLAALRPMADRELLEGYLAEVDECRRFIDRRGTVGLAPARPLEEVLGRVSVGGTVLDAEQALAVARTARVGQEVRGATSDLEDLPSLARLGGSIPDLGPLIKQIDAVLDEDGEVKDSASPELGSLRRKKRKLRTRLLDGLDKLARSDKLDGVLRDRLVTQRSGRFVVPVRSGKRGALPGVVHDRSSSGQTIYVEPLDSVDEQNALVEVGHAEIQEVQRLLAELTAHVRAASGALQRTEMAIAELDARQAKARLAELTGAVSPELDSDEWVIRGARHPLMIRGVMPAGENDGWDDDDAPPAEPVPLDLEIPEGVHALVITGPNTGGKTVVLKTVGLLTVMAQCGLPVPAASARLGCCPRIHADIGDEQSIIANLSTFSAHLTRINDFLEDSPPGSLVLLDELGTGTDPEEGAALGIAVIEHLDRLGALTLTSTHHDALKAFAHGFEGALNAAMEFDSETLQPTFRLRVGLPGRSNAFDIADRLGLDAGVVGRARGLIGVETRELDSLLRSVEGEAEALASDRQDVQQEQVRLTEAHGRYEAINRKLAELREELAVEGRESVEEALATVRRAGESLLAELAEDLGETRRSRAAQDRKAQWSARVGAAEADARGAISETVEGMATRANEVVAEEAELPETHSNAVPEALSPVDEEPTTPLQRGDPVVVMPLNLRGKVARDWRPDGADEESVEVDVHGKRLIVSRQQVQRLGC